MRPITLQMAAFGPYAGETRLDFDALGNQRLFVITGPTGSGKTTIFEAMLYALYGKLSKKAMDPASLRCDFLAPEDDTVTAVDFTFEIGGKRYHIHRQPKQLVAKKRGSGRREVAQEAVLECVGHEEFLPLSKIGEVDSKIKELVGLDEEQFKKIVMLPQGAFQEFLVSSTKDKIALLRQIFDTSLYDQALQRLKERVGDMTGAYNALKADYRSQTALLRFDEAVAFGEQPSAEVLEKLSACSARDDAQLAQLAQAAEAAGTAYAQAVGALNAEKQHNEDVRQWQENEAARAALRTRALEMAALQARVDAVAQARPVAEKETRLREEEAAQNKQAQLVAEAQTQAEIAKARLAQAEQELAQASAAKTQADAEASQLPQLTEKLSKMKDYMCEQKEHAQAEKALAQAEAALATLESEKKNAEEALARAEEAARTRETLKELALSQERAQLALAQTLDQERRQYRALSEFSKRAQAQPEALRAFEEAQQVFAQAEAALEKARAEAREQLAEQLAGGLEDGAPCPVCGALHHPKLAQSSVTSTDEVQATALRDQAQAALFRAQSALEQQDRNVTEAWANVQAECPTLEAREDVPDFVDILKKSGVAHQKELQQLQETHADLEQQLAGLANIEAARAEAQQKLSALTEKHTDLAREQSRQETLAQAKARSLKEMAQAYGFAETVDPAPLEKAIAGIETRQAEAIERFEAAQREGEAAKVLQARTSTAQSQAEAQFEALTENLERLTVAFTAARDAAFESVAAYEAAKQDAPQRETLQGAVTRYKEACTKAETRHDDLASRLAGDNAPHDLQAAENGARAAEEKQHAAQEAHASQKSRGDSNRQLIEKIKNLFDQFQQLESDYALLGQLRDVLSGKNHYNMQLETFAQAYYFEQMLAGANVRLARMTHGRYAFRRKETVIDARRQAGLDLDVMDQYTGRARDVSTLSGGESFKASLSLALGLADVVTSESGGVELSTIFIDEGFGTLDEESLDDTVETLISLQDSGRLVGVISHVAELKERIPAHLVVSGSTGGSTARFEVRE